MPVRKFPIRPSGRLMPIEDAREFPLPPPHGVIVPWVGSGGAVCGGSAIVVFKVPIEVVTLPPPSVTGGPPVSKPVKVVQPEIFAGTGGTRAGGQAVIIPFYRPVRKTIVGNGAVVAGGFAVVLPFDRYAEQRVAEEEELLMFWVA